MNQAPDHLDHIRRDALTQTASGPQPEQTISEVDANGIVGKLPAAHGAPRFKLLDTPLREEVVLALARSSTLRSRD